MVGIEYCGIGYWGLCLLMFTICGFYIKVLIDRFSNRDLLK